MNDFAALRPYQPRRFVPATANLREKAQVIALAQQLLQRQINSPAELTAWLADSSELDAVLDQVGSILYIRMTSQTDDPERAQAYRDFIENVVPAVRPLADLANRKFLDEIARFPLDPRRFEVYQKGVKADIEIFRPENIDLQTREALLGQEYQTLCGALTVQYKGEERTLPQMGKLLEETDRPVREEAWRLVARRRLQEKEKMESIYDQMLQLRGSIAGNAGFANYTDYKFLENHRFDYTPDHCRRFHEAVRTLVVPVYEQMLRIRREKLGIASLRPWDLAVDAELRPPLRPFNGAAELMERAQRVFAGVDADFAASFRMMRDHGLLDLESRKGKAPGGYQSTLSEFRKPFIFMNAVGTEGDVKTLLHEGGHAFHALAAAEEWFFPYRHAPLEFCEVASMGMELLSHDHLAPFYKPDEIQRANYDHLEGIISLLPWIAVVDAFQHWIYAHPHHSPAERAAQWLELHRTFMTDTVDWSGLEEERQYLWHRQLHIFLHPFYYIEYGIAQLGALQLWVAARQDFPAALAAYKRALALGGSRPLPELFGAANLRFDFSETTIAPLMQAIQTAIK